MPSLMRPVQISCPVFQLGAKSYSLCLPGNICLTGQMPDMFASPMDVCNALLGQLQVGISPFKSIFDVIGIVQCLFDALGAVTNPPKLAQVLKDCAKKIDDLAMMIPQLSVPIFIAGALDLLLCIFDGAVTQMEMILAQAANIQALQGRIEGPSDPLAQIVQCAEKLNQNRLCALNESMAPLNSIIELLNIFLGIAGMKPLPVFGGIGDNAQDTVAMFREFVALLTSIRGAMGIPIVPVVPRC